MSKKQDRRVQKTRRYLRDSLVELLQEKELRKITIRELCEKADINRSTFYLHYRDVFDLWNAIEQEVLEDMEQVLISFPVDIIVNKPLPLLLKISEVLEEEVMFNRKLFQSSESIILLDKLKSRFISFYMINSKAMIRNDKDMEFELYINFIMSGAFSLYHQWLTDEYDIPLADLSRLIERLIQGGIEYFLGGIKKG